MSRNDGGDEGVEGYGSENGNECFSGNGTIELEVGTFKLISELGMRGIVRLYVTQFSEVSIFTHLTADIASIFLRITINEI